MITLYHFGPFRGLPDPSPFCLKVDAYLRMAGLEFTSSPGAANLRKAPKGKLPFITDDGRTIADSAFIIAYLKERYGDPLDGHLDREQKAIAHAFIKMMDEDLYWCLIHSRWMDDNVWPAVREEFFEKLPFPMRTVIFAMVRRQVRKSLYLQGNGRHSDAERLEIAKQDLNALSVFLGDKPYFFGDRPSTLDAAAYAFLAEIIVPPLEFPLREYACACANLVSFCNRIRGKYYCQ